MEGEIVMQDQSIYARFVKRLIDIIVALILLIVISPILLIISIAIIIGSGKPIIYKQTRVGQYGKHFTIYKFRTMINGADKSGTSTKQNDVRVTAIGKFLRKTSLDELPQLLNVIKGDMSLVGFRPDVPREATDYSQKKWSVKPGITGYAQVNGRSSLTLDRLIFWESKYAEDISFATDVKILIKTVGVVLKKSDSN